MALALADKPYQLISPSHRQTASALANGTLVPLAACPAGQGSAQAGSLGRDAHSVSQGHTPPQPADSHPGKSRTQLADRPVRLEACSPAHRHRGPETPLLPPRSCMCPQGQAATCSQAPGNAHFLSQGPRSPWSHRYTGAHVQVQSYSLPRALVGSHSAAATHNTRARRDPQDSTQSIRGLKRKQTDQQPQLCRLPSQCAHKWPQTHAGSQPRGLAQAVQPPPASKKAPHAVDAAGLAAGTHLGKHFPVFWRQSTLSLGQRSPRTLSLSLGSWDGTPATVLNLLVGTLEIQELAFLAPNLRIFLG